MTDRHTALRAWEEICRIVLLPAEHREVFAAHAETIRAALTSEAGPVAWRWKVPCEDGHYTWSYATVVDNPKDPKVFSLYDRPDAELVRLRRVEKEYLALLNTEEQRAGKSNMTDRDPTVNDAALRALEQMSGPPVLREAIRAAITSAGAEPVGYLVHGHFTPRDPQLKSSPIRVALYDHDIPGSQWPAEDEPEA